MTKETTLDWLLQSIKQKENISIEEVKNMILIGKMIEQRHLQEKYMEGYKEGLREAHDTVDTTNTN